MQILVERAARADTDDVFHVVEVEKFVRIYADCGLSHARRHDGHSLSFIITGVAVDASDVVDQNGVFKEVFRNEFGAKRIARHKNGVGKIAEFCCDMRGWN